MRKAKRKPRTDLAPKNVRSFDEICQLPRDNAEYGDAWIILNGTNEIVIHNQKIGEASTGEVTLTRRQLNRFLKWWETGR